MTRVDSPANLIPTATTSVDTPATATLAAADRSRSAPRRQQPVGPEALGMISSGEPSPFSGQVPDQALWRSTVEESAETNRGALGLGAAGEGGRVGVAALDQRGARGQDREQAVGQAVDAIPVQCGQHPVRRTKVQRCGSFAGRGEHAGHAQPGQSGHVVGYRCPRHELVAVQPDLGREVDHPGGQAGQSLAERVEGQRHQPAGGLGGEREVDAFAVAEHPVRVQRVGDHLGAAPPAASSTAAVCQCAGSSTAIRVPGSTSHSSRSRFAAFAAQFAVVMPDSSMRSPVASS